MLKKCREYLQWVQNSVFEGEITEGNFASLEHKLEKILNKDEGDSVVIYKFRTLKYSERICLGNNKKIDMTFL